MRRVGSQARISAPPEGLHEFRTERERGIRIVIEQKTDADIVIIGTGVGGATLAYALKDSGARILMIERGDFLPEEPQNWDPDAVLLQNRYAEKQERWLTKEGYAYPSLAYYYVGGMTKVYSAVLPRMRREDFGVLEHEGGISPAWPLQYEELEPYYSRAEDIYSVHGIAGEDPTEPPRARPYPFPAIAHEPYIESLMARFGSAGLHPFHLPLGIDLGAGGRCVRCGTCEMFPCRVHAKSDSEVSCIGPALRSGNVSLLTLTKARRLITDGSGRKIRALEVEQGGKVFNLKGDLFVVSCGAIHTPALLLRSSEGRGPGLANSTGQVGRNLMQKNITFLVALDTRMKNPTVFQKTWGANDCYLRDSQTSYPLGSIQALGKFSDVHFGGGTDRARSAELAGASVEMAILSECLPEPSNRVLLTPGGDVQIDFRRNNLAGHNKLTKKIAKMLSELNYTVLDLGRRENLGGDAWEPVNGCQHLCGTVRCGDDPADSVLDRHCKAHALDNLYVVDASIFPSQSATNPSLTIAAMALRLADRIAKRREASDTNLRPIDQTP